MIIYEVNLSVDTAIGEEFLQWLRSHMEAMVMLEGFCSAELYEVEASAESKVEWCCHYRLVSRQALDRYLCEDAERMRADGIKHFGQRFSASRRIMAAA